MAASKEQVLAFAREIGLDLVGVTTPEPFERYLAESETRRQAYQARYAARLETWRHMAEPTRVLPGARAVLVLGFYYLPDQGEPPSGCGKMGRIVAYGHLGILQRARKMCAFLRQHGHHAVLGIHRKEAAVRAGLGMIGKHGLVINPQYGSWVAYQSIVTDADLAPDAPFTQDLCGSCSLCLTACPTQALYEPYRLDPRRCVTCLLTSQQIAPEFWPALGPYILGCDVCQEACPRNRGHAPKPAVESLLPDAIGMHPPLGMLLGMNERRFRKEVINYLLRKISGGGLFGLILSIPHVKSAVAWFLKNILRKVEAVPETFVHASENLLIYKRNAIIAAGNLQCADLHDTVEPYRNDPQLGPYAAWALERINTHAA